IIAVKNSPNCLVSSFKIKILMVLFNSKNNSNLSQWQVLNDVVMGGLTKANLFINKYRFVEFSGNVSLEDNGGFASVKYHINPIEMMEFTKLYVKVKGDGKRYQLRLKANETDRHSYMTYFETKKNWEEHEFVLANFYPTYRGRHLELPNFSGEKLEELGFMIANKTSQNYKSEIKQIRHL